MLKEMTRSKLIGRWFIAVALVVVASMAWGVSVSIGTGVVLFALCLVPPAIVLMLWHGVQGPTVRDVLRGGDRRT
ncbi:MAG: hypothetical protein DMF89_03445 [Acidobacteria bacterium]|nr:MAG: hypothetical protein DMF90_28065 [Acidobacteriota bacterium]PYR52252.1 MAG: hypothetical protein DMF89_03445 [Acidobacteriota bacterium]